MSWASITPFGVPVVPEVKTSSKTSSWPGAGQAATWRFPVGRERGIGLRGDDVDGRGRESLETDLARVGRVPAGAQDEVARAGRGDDALDRVGRHPQVERDQDRGRPASPRSRSPAARASTATRSGGDRPVRGRGRAAARRPAASVDRARGRSRSSSCRHRAAGSTRSCRHRRRRLRRAGRAGLSGQGLQRWFVILRCGDGPPRRSATAISGAPVCPAFSFPAEPRRGPSPRTRP